MDEEMRKAGWCFIGMGLFMFGWTNIVIPASFVFTGVIAIIFDNEFKF